MTHTVNHVTHDGADTLCGELFSRLFSLAAPAALALMIAAPAIAQDLPPALRALQADGLEILGPLKAPAGIQAWAARAGSHPVALYAAPDGQHVIAGTLLDKDGNDLTREPLQAATAPSISSDIWKQLETATWLADGKPDAARIVYVFTDPNCPYCAKFWTDARPWVDAGRVQLRHVIVGMLTPTSPGKAAALLSAPDPAKALYDYEARQGAGVAAQMAAGRVRPVNDEALKPLDPIPADIQGKLLANMAVMQAWSLRATPAFVWRDDKGQIRQRTGMPPSEIESVLGARP